MGLHFSKEEFASRKSKVLKSMKEQNINALLIFRQESMYWLTGYDTFGYVFFQTLILDQIFVEKGDIVNQGDIIGTLGSSGRSTGPHLDVRLNWVGTSLDPATVLNIN